MNDVVNAGKRVHVLSNDNICYEGVMYKIDMETSTFALQNVRSLGTTTRGLRETSGGYRVFRGQDIKDLRVVEDEEESTTATPSTSNPNTTTFRFSIQMHQLRPSQVVWPCVRSPEYSFFWRRPPLRRRRSRPSFSLVMRWADEDPAVQAARPARRII
jgi:Scd6-like Sm domain